MKMTKLNKCMDFLLHRKRNNNVKKQFKTYAENDKLKLRGTQKSNATNYKLSRQEGGS